MPSVIISSSSAEWASAFSGTLRKAETPGQVSIRATGPIQFPGGTPFIPSMTFPYAPNSINVSDMGDSYEQLPRPGREPLIYKSEQRLMSIDLTLIMTAYTSKGLNSAEFNINWLRLIARSDKDIAVIGLGEIASGKLFRIVDISVNSARLNVKQEITIAEVQLSLTEVHYDERQKIPGLIVIKDVPPPQQQSSGGRTSAGGSGGELWPKVRDNWIAPPTG
jgi:hypothetical protein